MKSIEKYRILVPDNKIRDYLLSLDHPIGRHKAYFFLKCGFEVEKWQLLQKFILSVAKNNEILESTTTEWDQVCHSRIIDRCEQEGLFNKNNLDKSL